MFNMKKFPWSNFHGFNLDWVISTVKALLSEFESLVEYVNNLIFSQYRTNVKDFGALGDDSTNNTQAIKDATTDALNNGRPLYFPKGIYLADSGAIYATQALHIIGDGIDKSILKLTSTPTTDALIHIDLSHENTYLERGCAFRDFKLVTSEAYEQFNGIGIKLTNVIQSQFDNIEIERFITGMQFNEHSFWCTFNNIATFECKIGWNWGVESLDNNNNTFNNCKFHGFNYGIKALSLADAMLMNNCDYSAFSENLDGRSAFYFAQAESIVINQAYAEGNDLFTPDLFEFNYDLASGGQIVINGTRLFGNSIKDGDAIKITGTVSLTILNPVFNGFDTCIVNESSGTLVTINKKSAIINAYLDLTGSTGFTHETDGKKFRIYSGIAIGFDADASNDRLLISDIQSPVVGASLNFYGANASVGATGAGGTVKVGAVTIHSGTGSPEGVVAGNRGDSYYDDAGGTGATLWVKESGGGTLTGWIAK